MTSYIVLRFVQETEDWEKYGGADASSPAGAIRSLEPGAGIFVAIPARSWKPLTVKTQNVVKLTIG